MQIMVEISFLNVVRYIKRNIFNFENLVKNYLFFSFSSNKARTYCGDCGFLEHFQKALEI